MTAIAVTEDGIQEVEPDQGKSYEQNLEDASEISTENDNVNFIVVKR